MNKRNILPSLIIAAIALLGLSVAATLTKAQPTIPTQALEVSPPSQELFAKPGETLEVIAKIRNRTDKQLPVAVRLDDFVASGSEGQVALTEKGPWAVSEWTTIAPTNFVLAAGEQKDVKATVSIPNTGAAGGRYGAFVFTVSGTAQPGEAVLTQEIASLFLIDIAGPRDESIAITSLKAPDFLEFGPVPFTITYKNSGNVHMKTAGVIAITDMFGKKIADVAQTPTNVFPGSDRTVTTTWQSKILFGRYTAEAIIASGGSENKTLTATTSFVVFPVRIAAIVILAALFLFMIRKRLSRAFKALMGK